MLNYDDKKSTIIKGKEIGVVAPSFFIEKTDNFMRGIQCLEELGAHVTYGRAVFSKLFNTTDTAINRANDINAMFADKNIDIIIAADGGCRAIEVLEHLDYDLIAQNPKPICGFSDITHILLAINAKTNIETIHGVDIINCLGAPASEQKQRNIQHFCNILTKTDNIVFPQRSDIEILRHGQATGIAVGGWLDALQHTCNTKYFPKHNGIILFLEAIDTELNKINMMLQSMRLSGVFDNVLGLIIGKLTNCDEKEYFDCSPSIDDIIMNACAGYTFPIIKNVDFGHGIEHLAIPIGAHININTSANTIVLNKRI